jgi:EAL domain-containing protein (putative c-di-GMP-specific phosphodiesterase class I)
LAGFEALIRWQHPEKGWLLPGRFIPLAEETGLIQRLDLWVMRVACQQLKTWQENYEFARQIFININFSPLQIQQIADLEDLQMIVERADIIPSSLKLEITESGLWPEAVALHTLKKFEQQGVRLCIDDFGTGYSSLSRLHHFPISTLKIDRSFITRLRTSQDGAAVVQTIITLAHTLGMDVVAEGIENADQLNKLQALGCEYGQGFLFSRALNAEAATRLVAQGGGSMAPQRGFRVEIPYPEDLSGAVEPAPHFPADYAG